MPCPTKALGRFRRQFSLSLGNAGLCPLHRQRHHLHKAKLQQGPKNEPETVT